jgi:hypothetical protein
MVVWGGARPPGARARARPPPRAAAAPRRRAPPRRRGRRRRLARACSYTLYTLACCRLRARADRVGPRHLHSPSKSNSGIAAGSFGYKLHIKLHTGVKGIGPVNQACQTETDDNKLGAKAASRLKKKKRIAGQPTVPEVFFYMISSSSRIR